MTRLAALLMLFAAAPLVVAAPVPKFDAKDQISLKAHINVKMDENLHSETYPNNNLKGLKAGVQKLGEHAYVVDEGVLQLGSASVEKKPAKIEGIKVGRTAARLHFLHGAGYSAEDGAVVGKYVVRYADKTTADIEIVYGKDLVDWWAYPGKDAPTHSKIAWEGENEASKGFEAKTRLYAMTWANPHPAKEIATLDFVATKPDGQCAPFLAAVTADNSKVEEKKK